MPSTYTLNNGIELIATGEQSGTWGDTTNVNFSLIDTALDGQVTITLGAAGSSGSPNSLAISDGSASNGRNRMLIFTDGGDLGASAFVQLTPNDAEKIFYVRNNLSGDRALVLFQGTYNAANDYEVPAGTTAVVFFNGGGAGAVAANVFNNAHFDSLNVVGNATVTGTATLASADINGGTIDGAVIGGTTPAAVTGTTGTFNDDLTVGTDVLFAEASTGRVGMGTTSPSYRLQIETSGTTSASIAARNTTGGAFFSLATSNSSSGSILFGDTESISSGSIAYSHADDSMAFRSAGDMFWRTGGNTERMRITSDGNVGIGTTNVLSPLTVVKSEAGIADAIEINNFTGNGSYIKSERSIVVSADYSNNSGAPDSFISFETDASEVMRITSDGNVGIGTTNPSADLHVSDASVVNVRLEETDGSSYTLIQTDAAGTLLSADPSNSRASTALRFALDGSERMRINSSGNVGIGTTNPQRALDVFEATANVARISNGSSGGTPSSTHGEFIVESNEANLGIQLLGTATSNQRILFGDADSAGVGQVTYDHTNNYMSFVTSNSERVRIDSTGNVGIGTTAPDYKLHVAGANPEGGILVEDTNTSNASPAIQVIGKRSDANGSASFSGKLAIAANRTDSACGTGKKLGTIYFGGNHTNGSQSNVSYPASIAALAEGTFNSVSDMPTALAFYTGSTGRSLSDANVDIGTERLRITNTGNVGIGTTSPSQKLSVSGNVTITGSLSKGSGSFRIPHPIREGHDLVHSFVEGPQADNIYRGKAALVNGIATVNLDMAARMTEGTFVALNGNVQCFTSNETNWTPVRGRVEGNVLTIEAQDQACTATVSWLVIGERIDPHMLDTEWTDENGRVITEPLTPVSEDTTEE